MISSIALIVLVLVALGYGIFKNDAVETQITTEEKEVHTVTGLVPGAAFEAQRNPVRPICIGEGCDGSMDGNSALMAVKIPLMEIDAQGYAQSFFYAPHTTQKTAAVLDATYRVLFSLKPKPEPFADGVTTDPFQNPIGYISSLDYDSVTIHNGVALVYLKGSFDSLDLGTTGGDMTFFAAKKQIEQAAFQFDTVQKVEVYLNGVEL